MFHKQLSLHLARAQRPIRKTVALFWAHTHRTMIRHLFYKRLFQHFVTPIDTNLSLGDCQIVRDPTIFFTARCSCNAGCMLVEKMPKDASIARYVTGRSYIISSRMALMFSDTTAVFAHRLLRTVVRFSQCYRMVLCSLLWCKR